MAHLGIESEMKLRSDYTKKAHQITAVKSINTYVETKRNMAQKGAESEIKLRSDNTNMANHNAYGTPRS